MEREKELLNHSGLIRGTVVLWLTFLWVTLVPLAGPIVIVMTPLPILYYGLRLERARFLAAMALALAGSAGLLTFLGHPVSLPVLLLIGFTGTLLAEILRKGYPVGETVLIPSLALFFCGLGFLVAYTLTSGLGLFASVEKYVAAVIRENLKLYEQMNFSPEQVALIRENAADITAFITGIFPAMALAGAAVTVWLNLLAGRWLFRRTGAAGFPDLGDLALWKAPEKLVWLLIAAGGAMLTPWEELATIGLNVLILCGLVYLFQGLAIAAFLFKCKQVPVVVRVLFYMLTLIQQYLLIAVIAVGLFDLWFDFRKKIAGIKDVQA